MAEIALKHDIVIVSDEVYREYVYDNEKQTSMLEFPEIAENCIVIDSESKRYSMCGVAKLGLWLLVPKLFTMQQ